MRKGCFKHIRNKILAVVISAALLLVVSPLVFVSGADAQETEYETPQAAQYEEDCVLVSISDGASAEDVSAAIAGNDTIAQAEITQEDIDAGFVKLPVAEGYEVADALEELSSIPEVEGAQPNFVYHISGDGKVPSDPGAEDQWGLDAINAYDAWELIKSEDAGADRVTIALIDNGVLTEHEDLKDNIVGTYNAGDKGTDAEPYFDDHGTHVAGIISAVTDNGIGVAGASYNAGILPIQVFKNGSDGPETTTAELCEAYAFIRENAKEYNIRVVNLSVGATVPDITDTDEEEMDEGDLLLFSAITGAYDDGILTVCSSGSEAGPDEQNGPYFNYPGDWVDQTLSVIAVQDYYEDGVWPSRAETSNYNRPGQNTKDISAPGVDIYSTSCDPSALEKTGEYSWKDGTSMAAPFVSAVAALVFTAEPSLTPGEVSDIICTTAQTLGDDPDGDGWNEGYGFGLVDAYKAVYKALGIEEETSEAESESSTEDESSSEDASSSEDTKEETVTAENISETSGATEIDKQEVKAPATGDRHQWLALVIMMIGSAAAIAALKAYRTKSKRKGRR